MASCDTGDWPVSSPSMPFSIDASSKDEGVEVGGARCVSARETVGQGTEQPS